MLDLAESTGLHPNTVRGHLDALVEDGLVDRLRDSPSGRGRPAWRYRRATANAVTDGSEYADLAAALADQLARTSRAPHDEAVQAGLRWGRALASHTNQAPVAPPRRPEKQEGETEHGDAGRRRVMQVLEQLHFAPAANADTSTVRLCACPLLDAARAHPDIVCGVHLGLIRGALEAAGDTGTAADLIPFAEPGACLLRLSANTGPQ